MRAVPTLTSAGPKQIKYKQQNKKQTVKHIRNTYCKQMNKLKQTTNTNQQTAHLRRTLTYILQYNMLYYNIL